MIEKYVTPDSEKEMMAKAFDAMTNYFFDECSSILGSCPNLMANTLLRFSAGTLVSMYMTLNKLLPDANVTPDLRTHIDEMARIFKLEMLTAADMEAH